MLGRSFFAALARIGGGIALAAALVAVAAPSAGAIDYNPLPAAKTFPEFTAYTRVGPNASPQRFDGTFLAGNLVPVKNGQTVLFNECVVIGGSAATVFPVTLSFVKLPAAATAAQCTVETALQFAANTLASVAPILGAAAANGAPAQDAQGNSILTTATQAVAGLVGGTTPPCNDAQTPVGLETFFDIPGTSLVGSFGFSGASPVPQRFTVSLDNVSGGLIDARIVSTADCPAAAGLSIIGSVADRTSQAPSGNIFANLAGLPTAFVMHAKVQMNDPATPPRTNASAAFNTLKPCTYLTTVRNAAAVPTPQGPPGYSVGRPGACKQASSYFPPTYTAIGKALLAYNTSHMVDLQFDVTPRVHLVADVTTRPGIVPVGLVHADIDSLPRNLHIAVDNVAGNSEASYLMTYEASDAIASLGADVRLGTDVNNPTVANDPAALHMHIAGLPTSIHAGFTSSSKIASVPAPIITAHFDHNGSALPLATVDLPIVKPTGLDGVHAVFNIPNSGDICFNQGPLCDASRPERTDPKYGELKYDQLSTTLRFSQPLMIHQLTVDHIGGGASRTNVATITDLLVKDLAVHYGKQPERPDESKPPIHVLFDTYGSNVFGTVKVPALGGIVTATIGQLPNNGFHAANRLLIVDPGDTIPIPSIAKAGTCGGYTHFDLPGIYSLGEGLVSSVLCG